MAAAISMAAPSRAGRRSRWIISRSVDLSLVIGSSAAGYVYLLLFTVFHAPMSWLWWIWSLGFDGTHIFGTASRTFFDREARARHSRLFYGSLIFFFALGPAMVLAGWKGWLYLLVGAWAYYHVIRQHYGFMVLYKVKSRDLQPLDNWLDRLFLGVMMLAPPIHRFMIHHPQELGLPRGVPGLETPMWIAIAATALVYAARQAVRWRAGDAPDVAKYLLFAAVIPLHWLTFAFLSWQAAVPTVTIVHNLQYHAIVWFHNRNRYGVTAEDGVGSQAALHGRIPAAVGRSLLAYAVIGLMFSAAYRIPGFALGNVSDLAFGFFCGFGLTHYYLDSRIWRVRHDPGLRQALQLAEAKS
jgi:hypothetical protein